MTRTHGWRRVAHLMVGAVAIAVGVAAAGSAEAVAAPTGTVLQLGAADAIDGSYIVVLKPGSPSAAQVRASSAALTRRYGGTVRRTYLSAVRGYAAAMTAAAAHRLAADPSVAYVEQDRIVRLATVQGGPQWGLDRIDQGSLPLSSSYEYRSAANVTAYVLDTGVRVGHTDFGGRARNGWDFIDSDAVANDCQGHGTHVAGTIGGATYGVAKDVSIVGVRVLDCGGSGSYSQIIAGVDWVTTHAAKPAVANLSLGGSPDRALDDAVQRSIAAGITYAVAAGNSAERACDSSPARAPAAITVGATDDADRRAWFSNFGTCVDIFAPGVDIVSARHSANTGTTTMSGTSMAAPHVAGAAALVLGAEPTLTPAQVRTVLVTQATAGAIAARGTGSPNLLLYTGGISTVDPPASPPVDPAPAAPCGPFTMGNKVMIKDLATVTSARKVAGCVGAASAASSVQVRVTHGHRGSLVVTLIAPNGAAYFLKRATTDAGDDLVATYPIDASGAPRNGVWTLTVRDTMRKNSGYLSAWTLRL